MNRLAKIYVSFFPIISLSGIVIANIISLINYDFYSENLFWISCFVGISFFSCLQNIAMVKLFKFCEISKYASYSMFLFIPFYIIDYLIFESESTANIIFQIVVGIVALILTAIAYIKKYPDCTFTKYIKAKKYSIDIWNTFLNSLAKNNFDCENALEDYKHQRQQYHAKRFN